MSDYGGETNILELDVQYNSEKSIIESYVSVNDESYVKNIDDKNLFYYKLVNLGALCPGEVLNIKLYIKSSNGKISDVFELEPYTYTCFPAGTKILTNFGYKNIEDIKINDIVYSFNEKTNKVELNTVAKTFIHEDTEIYEIYINDEIIKVTPHHRFYIKRNNKFEWIEVKDLTLTDKLFNNKNKLITINKIEYKKETNIVYNFEVQNNHTYFVSNKNILVHNVKAPC